MWLCLKLEAIQSDFLLTTTVTIAYLGRNLLVSTMFTSSNTKASTSEKLVYDALKNGSIRASPTLFSYRRFDKLNQGLVITNFFTRFKFATVSQNVKNVKIV